MADEKVLIRHLHIPDVSIPDSERSDTEWRAVTWHLKVKGRKALVDVVTGSFSLHKDLAGQVADLPTTRFALPTSMWYESAVLIGLRSQEGQISVFSTTHEAREKARIGEADTYSLLHLAAAGVAKALERGYELDHEEPSEMPHDLDQFPEPMSEQFEVTPAMLAEFDSDVQDGIIILHEEISRGVTGEPAAKRGSVTEFIKDYAVSGDVFSEMDFPPQVTREVLRVETNARVTIPGGGSQPPDIGPGRERTTARDADARGPHQPDDAVAMGTKRLEEL